MTLTGETATLLSLFFAAAGGFAGLVWWLAAQFNSVRSLVHEKHNTLDRRLLQLEWLAKDYNGHIQHWSAPDDDRARS